MSVKIFSRSKLPYLFGIILLCSGYFNYFVIAEVVVFFFRISSLTGQVLVNKFLSICKYILEIVELTYSFFQILYEDSLIFFKDATEKFTFVIYFLKELYLFLEEFGWNFLKILFQTVDRIFSFFRFVQVVFVTVKKGLHVIGLDIWHFFANIPESTISCINEIIEFVKYSVSEIIISILKVKEKVIQDLQKIYLFLFDIPLDSVYGLIIGAVIITIFCIKFKDIYCIISSAFLKLYQQMIFFGTSVWNGNFLKHNGTLNSDCSIEDDDRLCIVCQYQLKEIIIFPCKHLCLCKECSDQLEKNHPLCPICRSEITGTLKVYL